MFDKHEIILAAISCNTTEERAQTERQLRKIIRFRLCVLKCSRKNQTLQLLLLRLLAI